MLTGRYTSQLYYLFLGVIALLALVTSIRVYGYVTGDDSVARGLGLFEAIAALLALGINIFAITSLYRSRIQVEWKQGSVYLNGKRTLSRVRSIQRINETTARVTFNFIWSMHMTGRPDEVSAFVQAASKDLSIEIKEENAR